MEGSRMRGSLLCKEDEERSFEVQVARGRQVVERIIHTSMI